MGSMRDAIYEIVLGTETLCEGKGGSKSLNTAAEIEALLLTLGERNTSWFKCSFGEAVLCAVPRTGRTTS